MEEPTTVDPILAQFLDSLYKKLPDYPTRKNLSEETDSVVSPKTLANLDSLGEGIQPRLRICGKVCYPKEAAITWLKQRCTIEGERI